MRTKHKGEYLGLSIVLVVALLITAVGLISCEPPEKDPNEPLGNLSGTIKFWVKSETPWIVSMDEKQTEMKVSPMSGPAGETEVVIRFYGLEEKGEKKGNAMFFADTIHQKLIARLYYNFINRTDYHYTHFWIQRPSKYLYAEGFDFKHFNEQTFDIRLSGIDRITETIPLEEIDVSKCPKLSWLCLDITNGKSDFRAIKKINVSGTAINQFALGNIASQITPYLTLDNLEVLQMDNCPNTEAISIGKTRLRNIDLSKYPKLKVLHLDESLLSPIDISVLSALTELRLAATNGVKLHQLKSQSLQNLWYKDEQVKSIDLSNFPQLNSFCFVHNREREDLPEVWVPKGRDVFIYQSRSNDIFYNVVGGVWGDDYPKYLIKYK